MLKREEIVKILEQARQIDENCLIFGASTHQYRLNPPLNQQFVRRVEQKYEFTLPEDYFRFITQIGNGGAGPDYGILPFEHFLQKGSTPEIERYWQSHRLSLGRPFSPRPMAEEEVEEYAVTSLEGYRENPGRYLVCDFPERPDSYETSGFFVLGTHGCQWDFGLVTAGERRGQVLDTDNEGAYALLADSFEEFYQNWLDRLADTEDVRRRLAFWEKHLSRRT